MRIQINIYHIMIVIKIFYKVDEKRDNKLTFEYLIFDI
jgi:hypothetical protein